MVVGEEALAVQPEPELPEASQAGYALTQCGLAGVEEAVVEEAAAVEGWTHWPRPGPT